MILFKPFLLAVLVCSPLLAQNPRLQITSLERLSASAAEVVDITLDGASLRMAGRFLGNDKAVQSLVAGLQGIYVKTFRFDKAGGYDKADVDAILAQVQPPAWSRIVGVSTRRDGTTGIYLMADPGTGGFKGLVILSSEPKELVLVNIVGAIDMDKLAALEGKLGIPKLSEGRKGASHDSGK